MKLHVVVSLHREDVAEAVRVELANISVGCTLARTPREAGVDPLPAAVVLTGLKNGEDSDSWLSIASRTGTYLLGVLPASDGVMDHPVSYAEAFENGADPRLVAESAARWARMALLQQRLNIVGRSEPLVRVLKQVVDLASHDGGRVLFLGETGTGKEVMAKALHEASGRREGPFVALNVAALSESLIESELFGHVKGAFTGAVRTHHGCFERANGGTLLLDEIGELPLSLQAKLLRVLEDEQIQQVGGSRPIPVDVRVVSATNRDLWNLVEAGRFREDLFFRLAVLPVSLPPLRERPEDIPELVRYFGEQFAGPSRQPLPAFSEAAMRAMVRHRWPGNVRELRNVVERLLVSRSRDRSIGAAAVNRALQPFALGTRGAGRRSSYRREGTKEQEERTIRETLRKTRGNVAKAARELGMARSTLNSKLNEYGIAPWEFRARPTAGAGK